MAGAPPGSFVKITYDGDALHEGDALVTPSGRSYGVVSVRVQTRGKHAGRQHCRLLVLDERPTERVFPLVWNPRPKATCSRRPSRRA